MQTIVIVVAGLAVIAIGYVAACYAFADLLLYPKRQPVVRSPQELGLAYEDVEFKSTDGLSLKGWFIPGPSGKVLLVAHPMFCNRHGFLARYQSPLSSAKTDIDLLRLLKPLHEAGYSVLTFDLRNHGASERGITGVGLNEYQDVLGALQYLRTRADTASAEIGLFGLCMGANAMIVAMSKAPERFAGVRCFVAVQPVTMLVFVRSYIKNLYTPLGLALLPMMERIRLWRGGHPLGAMSPKGFARDIRVPALYAQARADQWTELPDVESIYAETPGEKEFWWMEGKLSRIDGYNYVGQHPERIVEFLRAHL